MLKVIARGRKSDMNFCTTFLAVVMSTISLCFCFCSLAVEADPIIRIEKYQHDFGKVEEGVEVSCKFTVHNDGDKPLKLEAKSTCGCTITAIKNKCIPAKSQELLTVVMDTAMKQGAIKKEITVSSNDPKKPMTKLFVIADVENPHSKMGHDVQAKIFAGRCAACHVKEGVGKIGEDLYLADCAMCHGFRAKGGVGPGLLNFNYDNKQVSELMRKIIAEGSATHRSMPGFSKKHGGPLTDKEIDSLIAYLSWRSKIEK